MSQKEEQDFIREKIKKKPSNKRKLFSRALATVGFAALFGFVACLVFCIMRPVVEDWFTKEPEDRFELPSDTVADDTQTDGGDTSAPDGEDEQTESSGDDTAADDAHGKEEEPERTVYITEKQTLEIKDYQVLQNKLYNIGRRANRSIVTVTGITEGTDIFENPYESAGQTAGFIVGKNRKELLVLTDHSVINEAKTIQVTFVSGDTVDAALKKYDSNTGLAILGISLEKIEETTMEQIKVADLGNSLNLQQGLLVIAIGSPQGTNYSILAGTITSVTNKVTTEDWNYTVFNTDIVAGSSGNGALLNTDGEIIGLIWHSENLQKEEKTLTAISISELKDLIEMLSNGQDIPYIGITGSTITDSISEEYDIPEGVYIKGTAMDSPAMAAGLQNGDVIVAVDGNPVQTMEDYQQELLKLSPGDEVAVTVNRQVAEKYKKYTCMVEVGTRGT